MQLARVLWEARPAANSCRPAQSQKLRPEGGPSTKAARAWRHVMQVARFSCGRRDPRRIQLAGPLKAKSFAPRAGLLRKQPVHGAALCRCHTFLVLWEARPAANAACRPAHAKSFAQGSGLPRSSPCVAPPNAAGTLFLWEARPAANAAFWPAQSQKLRPGVGAPTKLPVRGAVMCSLGYSTSMSRSCRQSRACRSVSSGQRFSGRFSSTLRAPAALAHSRSKR